MASAIIFFNQLSGGGALASFGASSSFGSVVGFAKDDILLAFTYLNLLQIIITLFAGQFL